MDRYLRAGFSEDQLKGVDLNAISKAFEREPVTMSPAASVIKETKTPNGSADKILATKSPEALLEVTETNGDLKEGIKFAHMKVNGYEPSQNDTATVGSSLLAPTEGVAPIAIIGMSCRLPGGASDIEKLWKLVSEGRSAWSKIPESRFNVDAFYHPNSDRTDTVSPTWCLTWCGKEVAS